MNKNNNINGYWVDKENRATQARNHTEEMNKKYSDEISICVDKTKIYNDNFTIKAASVKSTVITVKNLDTVKAGYIYRNAGKVALLNFASYKNAGGMFLNGSNAQEECLCHASFLYNVLSQFNNQYYDWNIKHKNRALYLNRGLYSPDIIFEYENKIFNCDVITCAAPNKTAAQKYMSVSNQENSKTLDSRIKFVLDIAKDNDVDTLILGAYGCGVFGQDPIEVAEIFKKYLTTVYKNCFQKVVFAIPEGRDGNLNAFNNVFSN